MKRILNTLIITAAAFMAFSCQEKDNLVVVPANESIVLKLSTPATRAGKVEHESAEAYVSHIDVFIFDKDTKAGKHYGRYNAGVSSKINLSAKRSSFTANQQYYVYLIANSTYSVADFAEDKVKTLTDLFDMKQEDVNIHLSALTDNNGNPVANAPKYFLMDAVATDGIQDGDNAVVLNNGDLSATTELSALLRRAAAKVVIEITASDAVTFKPFGMAEGSEGGLYYISNLPYQAYLLADAREDADILSCNVVNTSKSLNNYFTWNPTQNPKSVTLTAYVYPHNWESQSLLERETCVVMNLPLSYSPDGQEPVDYHNSWYKIHMTKGQIFERNSLYTTRIKLNRPGAVAESKPVEVDDIYYEVEPWVEKDIFVGSSVDTPKYLQLNTDHVNMYNVNVDDSSLEFASSSPISEIELVSAYYINSVDSQVSVANNSIKAVAQADVLNGGITITSPFVKDGVIASEDSHSNAIRYMTFRVTNEDGITATFTVNQYPTIYITNEMGKYSYRSDFGGTTYYTKGEPNRSGASWNNGSWTYNPTASNNVFFGSKVALQSGSGYTINYAYWGNNSNRVSTSVFGGLYNPRMYHIHVTATSPDYIVARPRLDADGYTESSAANTKLVSPSFMAASQLGATQNLTGGVAQAKAHCEQYIEVTTGGVIYDDWRLPTVAEIDIIIKHQEVSDAMATILTQGAYFCAYNTDNRGNVIYTKETGKGGNSTAVRCIRDAY